MSVLHDKLLPIWIDILQTPQIAITDDFYDLGGTSLRLIRMVGRIKSELGFDVFYGDLIRGTTIELLASLLEQKARSDVLGGAAPDSVPLDLGSDRE